MTSMIKFNMSAAVSLLSVLMLTPSPALFVSSFAPKIGNTNQRFIDHHHHQHQLHLSQSTIHDPTSKSKSDDSISTNGNQSQQLPQPPLEIEITPSPHAAKTLDGRLLCSSQCAYEIKSPYFRGSSYRPNTKARRVTRGINSALVGHTSDGITIAFRGTQTTSLLDWLQNAALFLSDVDEKKYKIQGKIHTGFYRGTMSLWKPLKGILKEMLAEAKENGWSQDIYLTGHSKGGALASLASILLKRYTSLPDPTYVW
jgi:hypothetical protein